MNTSVYRGDRVLVDGRFQAARVHVRDGVIAAVERGPEPDGASYGAADVVDVPDGGLLLPGNVDSHVHVNEPGRTQWEGFGSATESAARGGITTLVDMPLNSIPSTTTVEALGVKREAARPQLAVDAGYWGGAVPDNLGTLRSLWDAGVFGFKCFTIDSGVPEFPPLDDDQLDRAAAEIAGFGGLLIVHAEDPTVIAGQPVWSSRRYADFVRSRPDEAEVVAIGKVIALARRHGTRMHVLHLSSAQALDLVKDAKDDGLPLTVETCPHYLIFDSDSVPDGAAEFKCCPPIRDRRNQRLLWSALRDGVIDCVVSDHSPSTVEEKVRGDGDLALAWGGVSGLQVTFPTMVDKAAGRGFGIADVSRWMSAGPARVAGLAGKGAIAVGKDADLIVYQPGRAITVDGTRLAHRNKLTAYSGRTISGSVSHTAVRGRTVFDGRQVVPGRGHELLRAAPVSA